MKSYQYAFQSPLDIADILFILEGMNAVFTQKETPSPHFSMPAATVYQFTIAAIPVLDVLLPVRGIITQKENHCEIDLTIEHGGRTFLQLMEHTNFYFFNMLLAFILPVVGIVVFVKNDYISFEHLIAFWLLFFGGTVAISAYQVKHRYQKYAQYLGEKLSEMPEIDEHIQALITQIGK